MKLTIFTTGFMSSTLLHSTSWYIMQCRNINSLVQSTSATRSPSLFSRPTFFPVKDGEPSVVTLTIFCHGNCIVCKAFSTHSKISSPVVMSFIDSIDSNSSVISKFSEMPRTKMSNCAVSSMSVLSSNVRETAEMKVHALSVVMSGLHQLLQCGEPQFFSTNWLLQTSFCVLDRLDQPHRACTFWQIHHHKTICCA